MAGIGSTPGNGLPINNLIGVNAPPSPTAPQSQTQQLGEDAFLKLLTVQLSNQDPLKPMDDTQTIAQLAQFTQVQSTNELKTSFQNFQSNFAITQSASFLGRNVSAQVVDSQGNTQSVVGVVKSITVANGQALLALVDSSGNPIVDSTGTAYGAINVNQIVSIGT